MKVKTIDELEKVLTRALSTPKLFTIWLDGKKDSDFLGMSNAACFDPVAFFIEEVIGLEAWPVVLTDSVFSRGLVIPLCSQLREVVQVTDFLGLEEIRKRDLVEGLRELREGPTLLPPSDTGFCGY